MPKKKQGMTPAEQSERFEKEAQRLVDAGELSPTEADKIFHRLFDSVGFLKNKEK